MVLHTDPIHTLSPQVDKRVSRADMLRMLRDSYEGTPFDLTKGIFAGPWGNPTRNYIEKSMAPVVRCAVAAKMLQPALLPARASHRNPVARCGNI